MAGAIGLDSISVRDAETGTLVPVAGDFDGGKWLQALILAFGALDGDREFVADADGQRLPVDSPTLLAALQGVLQATDVTPLNTSIIGSVIPVGVGETLNLIDQGGGRVMVTFQFFADDPTSGAYCEFQFGHAGYGMRLLHGGGSPDLFTADSVDVNVVNGSGVVAMQVWGTA